jgi:hypothetical protein
MLDTNPLRDGTMNSPVNISRDARGSLAHHANLRLKDRRRVHDDDFAFRFWIDRKLGEKPSKIKPNQPIFSVRLKSSVHTFLSSGGRSVMTAPATAPEATMPTRGLHPRQQTHLMHIIAEIAHQGSSPNHGYTVSALLSCVCLPLMTSQIRCSTWRTRDEEHVVNCHVTPAYRCTLPTNTDRKHAIAAWRPSTRGKLGTFFT